MTHKCCTQCTDEYPDRYLGISVLNISVDILKNGKKKTIRSDGPHWFCSIPCLNTFIFILAGEGDD